MQQTLELGHAESLSGDSAGTENFLVQNLEVFINKIAQKVASWFGQKSAPQEDEPVEETAI